MSASGLPARCARTVFLGAALLFLAMTGQSTAQTRVDIFDSRAIALVRIHCADIESPAKALYSELKEAEDSGDEKEIARVKRLGPLYQAQIHDMVFGTGSVNHCFEELRETLAAIAVEENLHLIVSKWETAFLSADVTLVDVTSRLVEFYRPDDKVREMLSALQNREPSRDAVFLEN